jgi:thioesterase domain-containing protein
VKAALQKVLLEEIPLTQAMGLRVLEAHLGQVILAAPLEPNHNHKSTAFGGSLYSLAVLAGWSLLWLHLRESGLKGHVVIARSQAEFLRPVATDFQASARVDPATARQAVEQFRRKGRAKVPVNVSIGPPGAEQVIFVGVYALVK